MNTTYIYLITNIDNDPNTIYIGKTKNNTRESNHKRRFGSQIIFNYIDKVNSLNCKEWMPLESYWIEQFTAWGFKLINKNKGGNGPSFRTEDEKQKISKSNKGRKLSLETKYKMKLAKINRPSNKKGKKESIETRNKKSISKIGKCSPKKGKTYGPNLKPRDKNSKGRGPNLKLSNRKGKQNNGVKILDIKNNIIFDSKVKCAQYNGFNINKMRKLVDENIYYKRF
jgi:hypothetical protein